MLKIIVITLLSCFIQVNTSFSQSQGVNSKNKVKATELKSNNLQQPNKINYKSTSVEKKAESKKKIESNENQEYPIRVSSGTPHNNSTQQASTELTKEEKIQKLEKHITSAEWKIEYLKEESETGNATEIQEKEIALEILKEELENLKK